MIDYIKWAEEYEKDADRVKAVIRKKKDMLSASKVSSDERKRLSRQIREYRFIYGQLTRTASHLRMRDHYAA